MIVVVAATALAVASAVGPLFRSAWPPGAFVAVTIEVLAVGVVATYFMLSFDYARIRLALSDRGGVLRAWLSSLWLVARHPVQTYGLACIFAILFAAVAAGYLFAVSALGTHTMRLILVGMAIQAPGGAYILAWNGKREGNAWVFGAAPSQADSRPRASDFDGVAISTSVLPAEAATVTPTAGTGPGAPKPEAPAPAGDQPSNPRKKSTPAGPITIPGGG